MVASLDVSVPSFEFRLPLGELPPGNDQAMFHAGTPASTVADYDLEVDELAFYRQDDQQVWCSCGAWDM